MQEESYYIFLINNVAVDEISGKDLESESKFLEFKSNLAASRGIPVDEIEVNIKSLVLPEYTDTFVRYDGTLMYRKRPEANPILLTGVFIKYDINHEELFDEFLDVLFKKQFDNALGFN
jgi:hypothetical protein